MGQKARRRGQDDGLDAPSQAGKEGLVTWDDDDFYDLSFAVGRSRRYHAKMQSFYQSANDLVTSANALLSAGAFMALLGGKTAWIAQVATGVVAAISAIATVYSPARKARTHGDLCRRFTDLAAKMAVASATESNRKKFLAERLKIEKDEPPVKRLIDLQAFNEEARARGVAERQLLPLSRTQRWFGYLFTFGMRRLERWRAEEERLSARHGASDK